MGENEFRYKEIKDMSDPVEQPSPSTAEPSPPPTPQAKTAEQDTLQIVYTKYEDGDLMHREGIPTKDAKMAADVAVNLLRRHDVREVFLCTVHSAFSKEVTVKKVI